ncbi:peptidoglycan recognition protein [Streptomyces sp. NPDC059373]
MLIARRLVLRRIAQAAAVCGAGALSTRSEAEPAATTRVPVHPQVAARYAAQWSAPKPVVVARAHWETGHTPSGVPPARYARAVKAVFIHHTDSGNDYQPSDVPAIIRNIYRDQTQRRGWDDIGYNFLVDKDGTIYEGRHGGIDEPVVGAHTSGFNIGTVGIAAIGTFTSGVAVPAAMLDAIARLTAWKLGRHGVDPRAMATLTCTNTASRYHKGVRATVDVVSGHRDVDETLCPGSALHAQLPRIRAEAARLQGRAAAHRFG